MYDEGKGVAKDDYKAVELYRKSCNSGNAKGCNNLGVMYETGKGGLPVDYKKAIKLYRKACNMGIASACTNLGNLLE